MSFEVGNIATARPVVTDPVTGAPVNTATVVITFTAPDGTITTPAVTNTGAGGLYTATIACTQVGTYLWRGVSSGTVVSAHEDQFSVRAQGVRLISLADAKAQLNITTTDQDLELADLIDSLTSDIEYITGPVLPKTCVETLTVRPNFVVGAPAFVLGYTPVITLTSVAADGPYSAPALTDLRADGPTGCVYRLSTTVTSGRFIVTYQAGRAITPPAVGEAGRIILQHQWRTQHNQAAGRPTQFDEPLVAIPGIGYAVPYSAAQKLETFRRPSAVA